MNRTKAIADIQGIFAAYHSAWSAAGPSLAAKTPGKLYELYVLSKLIEDLNHRGFQIIFKPSSNPAKAGVLEFKASPGQIRSYDAHFEMAGPTGRTFYIFVDIEFRTLGSASAPQGDYSALHEVDIVVVDSTPPYPSYYDIALAVECKCVANFGKHLIKEALGIRRELSLLRVPQPSTLSAETGGTIEVPAEPPSEYWLAFIDPKGSQYALSPATFGIELRHYQP